MSQYTAGTRAARLGGARGRPSAFARALRGGAVAALAAIAVVGLAACSGSDAADTGSTFTPAGTATGDLGGSVEVNVEVGECVTIGGSGDFASAVPVGCGSMEATHKVVGKAPKAEQCVSDVDAAYSESILGVAEAGALCLDIDWAPGHCFDLSAPKRVDCGAPGPDVIRAGERIEGTTDATACGEHAVITYPVRNFVICVEETTGI